MVLPHRAGREEYQRQPEQQVQIGSQDRAGDITHQMKEVMVVVPVNRHVSGQDKHIGNLPEISLGLQTGGLRAITPSFSFMARR